MTKVKGTVKKTNISGLPKKKFITTMASPPSQADEKLSTQQKTVGMDFLSKWNVL
jgi:signal recognition particle receptor subunit beta